MFQNCIEQNRIELDGMEQNGTETHRILHPYKFEVHKRLDKSISFALIVHARCTCIACLGFLTYSNKSR